MIANMNTKSNSEETLIVNKPIISVCSSGSRIGCAIYNSATSELSLIADMCDPSNPFKILDIIISQIDPGVVIVSAVQGKVIDYIESRFDCKVTNLAKRISVTSKLQTSITNDSSNLTSTEIVNRNSNNAQNATRLSFIHEAPSNSNLSVTLPLDQISAITPVAPNPRVPSILIDKSGEKLLNLVTVVNQWYSLQTGIKILLDSPMVNCKRFNQDEEKSFFLSSKVKINIDVCAVRSISCLYQFFLNPASIEIFNETSNIILNNEVPYNDDSNVVTMPILDVKYIDPGPIMTMDKYTYESLRIFNKTGNIKISTRSEQVRPNEMTLFDLLNRCSSSQGRRHMRTILLWPLQGLQQIQNRLNTLEYLMHPDQTILKETLQIKLSDVKPLAPLLTRMSYAIGTHRDFSNMYKVLFSIFEIHEIIEPHLNSGIEVFHTIDKFYNNNLKLLLESIVTIINFDDSKRLNNIQVNAGVSDELDRQKKLADSLEEYCLEVSLEETEKYKDILKGLRCNVSYVPRLGFLNCIQYCDTEELKRIRESECFEVIIQTEDNVYLKTDRMNDLDMNAGDVICDLIDKQEDVLVVLQEDILKYSENILGLVDSCGYLDCLMAFADVSLQFGYVRPQFEINGTIDITNGYHPLLSITKADFVPNDVIFFDSTKERISKVMILTGPNSSGKTVYIKSTCLIVFMAHIGCFVPAERATLPLVDAILTRLHPVNSISTGLSSFGTDLYQVGYALEHATNNSLVALDEFGKGTNPEDGFILLRSLVTYFARRDLKCPYLLISTHYYTLIDHLNHNFNVLPKTFEITRDNTQSVSYKYRLKDGRCIDSLADNVARIAGIPSKIIDRAGKVRTDLLNNRRINPMQPPAA